MDLLDQAAGFITRINCRKISRPSNWIFRVVTLKSSTSRLGVDWHARCMSHNGTSIWSPATGSFSPQWSKFSLSFETNFEWKFGSWNQSSSSSYTEIAMEMESWVLQIFAKRQINRRFENERSVLSFFVSCCIANRILIFFPLECIWWMSSFANELNSRSQWNKLFTLISVKSPRVSQWEFKFRSILKFNGSEVLKVMVRRLRLAAKQFQLKLHLFIHLQSHCSVEKKKAATKAAPHTGTSQPKIVKIKCYNNHWHWKTLTFLSIFFLFVTSHSLTRLPSIVCHIFNISPKEWSEMLIRF